jgi:hypothetical protein
MTQPEIQQEIEQTRERLSPDGPGLVPLQQAAARPAHIAYLPRHGWV